MTFFAQNARAVTVVLSTCGVHRRPRLAGGDQDVHEAVCAVDGDCVMDVAGCRMGFGAICVGECERWKGGKAKEERKSE
jgi:hypothetical protein